MRYRQIIFLLFGLMVFFVGNAQEKEADTVKSEEDYSRRSFEHQTEVLFFKLPIKERVEYDRKIGKYIIRQAIGKTNLSFPKYLTEEAYKNLKLKSDIESHFKKKIRSIDGKTEQDIKERVNLLPSFYIEEDFFRNFLKGNQIKFIPSGSVDLGIGFRYQTMKNPMIPEKNRISFTPEFNPNIAVSTTVTAGKKLRAQINYDSNSTFSFQNHFLFELNPSEFGLPALPFFSLRRFDFKKPNYDSNNHDAIIKHISVGNVTMDAKNTLIASSQNLFGVKTTMQFGPTMVTGVIARQKGQTANVTAQEGGLFSEFELHATQYDNDKHFFLSQNFRNRYNEALEELPLIHSGFQITKVEVWLMHRTNETEQVRNIIGFVDLGESGRDRYDDSKSNISNFSSVIQSPTALLIPNNDENSLGQYIGIEKENLRITQNIASELTYLKEGIDYTVLENARMLDPSEFTFQPQLGYISLRSRLNEGAVMAVAYEYLYKGEVYRVGEFSTDGITNDKNLILKLIKPQLIDTESKIWNLMMKNIYAIGKNKIQKEEFRLNILYRDDAFGQSINNLIGSKDPEIRTRTLLNLTKLDRLDFNNNLTDRISEKQYYKGDGFFDYVEGITIDSEHGNIIFPTVEPFGRDLASTLTDDDDRQKYAFEALYNHTASVSEQEYQKKDKFLIKGICKSSEEGADGILIGFSNIARGSVKVKAEGVLLKEGLDYEVDYFIGRVKIINPAIKESKQKIDISLENKDLFEDQIKNFMGIELEYKFMDDFVIGANFLKITEKPFIKRIQFGKDPVSNSIYGLNINYKVDLPGITDFLNYLNIKTEIPSGFSVKGEFAYLNPDTSSISDVMGETITYVDDFEEAKNAIDIGSSQDWYLASVPVGFDGLDFGEKNFNSLEYGKKRAKLSWYTIDPLFYNKGLSRPSNIDVHQLSRSEVRPIKTREIFPEKTMDFTDRVHLRTFDLTYFPNERGPYNYESIIDTSDPKKIDNPQNRWAGITRSLPVTDFQKNNIQYLEFWLQDPYQHYSISDREAIVSNSMPMDEKGSLYINLGDISEDILKDGRKFFENGLPINTANSNTLIRTNLSRIPFEKSFLYAFERNHNTRINQDLGFDGMDDEEEKKTFSNLSILDDPSSDNYQFFRGRKLDREQASILKRYKNYNNTQGNSNPLSEESFATFATNNPDVEDINRDQNMNVLDAYWQYKVDLSQNNLSKMKNPYIVDEKSTEVALRNGEIKEFKWYLFRIPISDGTSIQGIRNFQTIRFMRLFLTDFQIPITLRFANMGIIKGNWRLYDKTIDSEDNTFDRRQTDSKNLLNVGVVNIEENENRVPLKYVLPPGIKRENIQGFGMGLLEQNEQSLMLTVNDVESGNIVGVYKNMNIDMRMFKSLKMFIHAEEVGQNTLNDGDISAIIRLGSDINDNYYQMEIPLKITNIPNFEWSNSITSHLVWPEENNLNLVFQDLIELKLKRDEIGWNSTIPYTVVDKSPESIKSISMKVKGYPNLSNVRTVFMGIKNKNAIEKTATIWFNELRLSGLDNKIGWATKISADATFSDVANIFLNGNLQSVGFGEVDQQVNERSLYQIRDYSVKSAIELGRFFSKKFDCNIPLTYSITEGMNIPKFNVKYEDVLSKRLRNSEGDIVTKTRNISLINVRKNRIKENPPKIYDIENFSFSYIHSDVSNKNYLVQKDLKRKMRLSGNYNFTFKQIEVEPFSKIGFLKSEYLRLIRDFNFNVFPTSIGLNSNIKRSQNIYKIRDFLLENNSKNIDTPTFEQQDFHFNWDYNIIYRLSRRMDLNFNAKNNRIYDTFESNEKSEKIGMYSKIFHTGRPSDYKQNLNINYKIPIDKFPFLSFISSNYVYNGNFSWQAPSPFFAKKIGNTIRNGQMHHITSGFSFEKLYKQMRLERILFSDSRAVHLLHDLLVMLKAIKVGYQRNATSFLNGYSPRVGFLGMGRHKGTFVPNPAYVFGFKTNILGDIYDNFLLARKGSPDEIIYNKNYNQTFSDNLNYNVLLRPMKNLTIQLNGTRNYSTNSQRQIDYIKGRSDIESTKLNNTGNFKISYSLFKTSFNSDMDNLFRNFIENRRTARNNIYPNWDHLISGNLTSEVRTFLNTQSLNSQEVLIHSFLSAYSGNEIKKTNTIFKQIPIPDWKITYTGLTQWALIKDLFSNFSLVHGYSSSYTINNFSTNLNSEKINPFQSDKIYSGITLVDNFSPLIKLNMTLKNSLSLTVNINKNRLLSLNLGNITLSEMKGSECTIGVGYRIKDVSIFSRKRKMLGDIDIRGDISFISNITNIRNIALGSSHTIEGRDLLKIKLTADYHIASGFRMGMYYQQDISNYPISTLYDTRFINGGVRFTYNFE